MRRFGSKILAGLKTRKRNRRLSLHNSHVFEGAVLNKNFCNVISCYGNFYSSGLDAMGFHFANIPDKNLIHVYKGFTLVNFITNVRHNLQYIHFGKFDKFRLFSAVYDRLRRSSLDFGSFPLVFCSSRPAPSIFTRFVCFVGSL